ncbi:hypothetical protein ILYODFUR_033172 [Ilyodon furcidens]|uniref:Secreted protein n=1 Tax=Ilyodon furcidens TaxID=33524 RepID=A0ABV0U0F5_9TELE
MYYFALLGCVVVLQALLPCSKKVLGSSPGVCIFFPFYMRGFSQGTLASSHSPKTKLVGFLCYSKSLPCDGLATCPGCSPTFLQSLMEMGPTKPPMTLHGLTGIDDG